MNWKYLTQRAFSYPPHIVVIKTLDFGRGFLKKAYHRRRDARRSTYIDDLTTTRDRLYSYFKPLPLNSLKSFTAQIAAISQHFLEHRFDLLGSGWVQVKHGMTCRGLENNRYPMGEEIVVDSQGEWLTQRLNRTNVESAQSIWRLVDNGYIPIDWHLDFKSGYRWDEATWYQDIPYAHLPGVDIKAPWELARMQHLTQLGWAYALASGGNPGFAEPSVYLREFRNQVLDFIATNPPRFGVNWRSTMDVAIRVANWLVTYDLFRAYNAKFDDSFERAFQLSVFQHGVHIVTNLEWYPQGRSNHYLSDIVGLLYVAAYLPRTPQVDMWLAFAVQELVNEVEYQFHLDGSNFEASTSYHRLSAEMVVYGTSLILSLPSEKQAALREYNSKHLKTHPVLKPAPMATYQLSNNGPSTPFPKWYFERLEKMAEFTMHITKPDGNIPQIGDNDSGRFFKLMPTYSRTTVAEAKSRYANLNGYENLPDEADFWDEEVLDHRHLVAAINGFFDREDFTALTGKSWLETDLIRVLIGTTLPSYYSRGDPATTDKVTIGTIADWEQLLANQDLLPEAQRQVLEIPIPGGNLRDGIKLYTYPDFGLYIYKTNRLYLAIRCGPLHHEGTGGHAHNDQLSIVLNIDGEDWIVDPGTYLYTPLPERRNAYRSIKAHFSPKLIEGEPSRLDDGLFELRSRPKTTCLTFYPKGFAGKIEIDTKTITRSIQIKKNSLLVIDTTTASATNNELPLTNDSKPIYSNAYGKQISPDTSA